MKTKFFIAFWLLALTVCSLHAQTKSDVFKNESTITWLGIDFSKAKLIGDRDKYSTDDDIKRFMMSLNELMMNEYEKFNVTKALDRTSLEKAINITEDHNAKLDVTGMATLDEKPATLTDKDVQQIISKYKFESLKGIGLMINVETMSKLAVMGTYWVTFVNMDTKEVLFTEKMSAPPKGFGVRNYWAGSIYEVLNKIKKKEFAMWRKKYYRP